MKVYDRIKQEASDKGWTLQEVAEKAGLGTNSIYRWRTMNPKMDSLVKVAEVLGVSVDYLLGTSDERKSKTSSDSDELTKNQKLIAYSIDPDISDEERQAIIELVKQAMKFRRRV